MTPDAGRSATADRAFDIHLVGRRLPGDTVGAAPAGVRWAGQPVDRGSASAPRFAGSG